MTSIIVYLIVQGGQAASCRAYRREVTTGGGIFAEPTDRSPLVKFPLC